MSWKKHFRVVSNNNPLLSSNVGSNASEGTSGNFASYLPEVYAGHPNRIQRYYQYEDMDRDSDIAASLDTIADFCTQSEEQNDEPFQIYYNETPTDTEVRILKEALSKWVSLNKFRSELWTMFRNTIKAGDQIFLRDPETFRWVWVDHFTVEGVKVDDSKGKEPEAYLIRGLSYNDRAKYATEIADPGQFRSPYGNANVLSMRPSAQSVPGGMNTGGPFALAGTGRDVRQQKMMAGINNEIHVVDAQHVIHLSLSNSMNPNWPFGTSVLESIYKTYKQKEMLEDAIIIYRVQRAPERRIFYIDVGSMPPARAKAHIESIKNEIHQRRIPNKSGGGSSILDAAYNPLSVMEDYFFANNCLRLSTKISLLDGRELLLSDIIKEYNEGKKNYVYSLNMKNHEFEPGLISWAGVTRKNAQMVRVNLDNGEYVDTTPDHRFITRDGKEVEAKDLLPGTSLMPLYRFNSYSGKNQKTASYERYLCNATGKKKYTHISISKKQQGRDFVVHHKDFNSRNNNPDNLEIMTWHDHEELHKKIGSYSLGKQWKCPIAREKLLSGIRKYHKNISETDLEKMKIRNRDNGSKVFTSGNYNNSKFIEAARNIAHKRKLNFTKDIFNRLVEIYDSGIISHKKIIPLLKKDEIFLHLIQKANPTISKYTGKSLGINDGTIRSIVAVGGYKDWDDFKSRHTPTPAVLSAIKDEATNSSQRMRDLNHNRIMKYNSEIFSRMLYFYNNGFNSISKLSKSLGEDDEYKRLFFIANKDTKINIGTGGKINAKVLSDIAKAGGYSGWNDFKESYSVNHKVVSVEWLDIIEDTGDITVESESGSHVFAVSAGVYVHNSEGRGSKVETLPGGDQTGEITDLSFFSKKLMRGLRIPPSYMPFGDDQGASYNDGKLGSVLVQEFRFNKYCMRIQSQLAPEFDKEFKYFLQESGIEVTVDHGLFELRFNPPQNFGKYRQIEVDAAQANVYQQVADNRRLSERFKFKRFLNLTDDEIIENERLWREENADRLKKRTGVTPAETEPSGDLSSVGFRPPSMDDSFMPDDIGGEEADLGNEPTPDAGLPTGGPGPTPDLSTGPTPPSTPTGPGA